MKLLLNTASRTSRLGCAYPSPLERTVANCPPEQRAELKALIEAELAKVGQKLRELSEENERRQYRRGTRSGVAWGARYNRAVNKEGQLRAALRNLCVTNP